MVFSPCSAVAELNTSLSGPCRINGPGVTRQLHVMGIFESESYPTADVLSPFQYGAVFGHYSKHHTDH